MMRTLPPRGSNAGVTGGALAFVLPIAFCAFACGGNGETAVSTTAVIEGNVSSASTAMRQDGPRLWIARLPAELLRLFPTAHAQSPDTSLAGIEIAAATVAGDSAATATDDSGAFVLRSAPSGDLTLTFRRGLCESSVDLPDVTAASSLALENVSITCTLIEAGAIRETFRAIVRATPEPGTPLDVCARSGEEDVQRSATIDAAEIEDRNGEAVTGEDLDPGMIVEISGQREAAGSPSTVTAETVRVLESGRRDPCSDEVPATPTPSPEPTPTPTVAA